MAVRLRRAVINFLACATHNIIDLRCRGVARIQQTISPQKISPPVQLINNQ
jgi:hypothetical protein